MIKTVNVSLFDNIGNEITFITTAEIVKTNKYLKIEYIELTDLKFKTTLYIYNEEISMQRVGLISMYLKFNKAKTTYLILKSSIGQEIKTEMYTLYLSVLENKIEIMYQTISEKENNIYHTLKIWW